ncbi:MAG: hypothetical protein MK042_07270 [Cognatishimia sp.]|nr:hypothetical protein [Cognatishimia sp.]
MVLDVIADIQIRLSGLTEVSAIKLLSVSRQAGHQRDTEHTFRSDMLNQADGVFTSEGENETYMVATFDLSDVLA